MKLVVRSLSLLLSLIVGFAFVACDSADGGTLQPDVPAGGVRDAGGTGDGSGAGPADTVLPGDRDTVYRDLPPTDWSWPEDVVVDPLNSVAGIQQDELGLTCDPSIMFLNYPDTRTLTDLVVLSPRFDVSDGLNGYHAAQGPGPWQGIQLIVPADVDPGLLPGDVIDVNGEGKEFFCLTQFQATEAPLVKGQSGLPPAEDVAPETLAPAGTGAEPYEGSLVRLTNVHVFARQSWGFTLSEGRVVVTDPFGTGRRPAVDCQITSLVGVVTYSFEEYKIVLLRPEDVVYANEQECTATSGNLRSVTEIQHGDASAACDTFAEASGFYPPDGDDLELQGLIVTTPPIYVSSGLRGYYIQEPQAAPWAGILAVFGKDDDPGLLLGDIVTARGDWQEYRCLTQLKIAQPVADNLVKTGAGEVPLAIDVDAARVATEPAYAEPYEGVLVRVADQTVTELPTDANFWQVGLESGLKLAQAAAYNYDGVTFTVGQVLPSITGVLYGDTYNKDAYLLAPRNAADFGVEAAQ